MKRILVIDDAATVRMYHRTLLLEAGWQAEEAVNGLEALERVQALGDDDAFDLYLVDVNMPRMDGLRFVRELRRLPLRHQAPVVMVSTEAQPHDAAAALSAGANTYLVKPARPGALQITVALLLGDAGAAMRASCKETEA